MTRGKGEGRGDVYGATNVVNNEKCITYVLKLMYIIKNNNKRRKSKVTFVGGIPSGRSPG